MVRARLKEGEICIWGVFPSTYGFYGGGLSYNSGYYGGDNLSGSWMYSTEYEFNESYSLFSIQASHRSEVD